MNVSVQHRHRAEALEQRERLLGVVGAPSPIGVHGPERDMREDHDRRGRRESTDIAAQPVELLLPEHLTDVRSTDQHNVKPWFNGRLDFSPTVPRLDDQGFPLVGGRIDYVDGRTVAVVVYTRRQHVINVFTGPVEGDRGAGGDVARDTGPSRETRHGYNILHRRSDGTDYWVASDLNVQELEQFAGLLRRAEMAAEPAPPTTK